MKLCFDSIEEIKEFMKRIKGTRGGKNTDEADEAETPAAPVNTAPVATPGPMTAGPSGGAPAPLGIPADAGAPSFPAAGFPGTGAATPAGNPLVDRIVTAVDKAIAGGQNAEQVLNWFRGQCGAEAAQASLDQIKQIFLPKLAAPQLEQIAKLVNA